MSPPRFRLLAITPPTGPVPADILDRWRAGGVCESLDDAARIAHASAPAIAVLLREPGKRPRELLAPHGRLAALRRRCADAGVPVLLNLDAADLAEVPRGHGLAGLHLRGDPDLATLARARAPSLTDARADHDPDLATRSPSFADARSPALLRPGLWDMLGRSCHGAPQPGHALVDYTLFAPVFPPSTAQPGAPLGSKRPAGLAALAAWTREPGAVIFALGGVGPATAAACLAAGAHGLAGIGVFFGAPAQVEQDVAALRDIVAAHARHVESVSPR